MDYTAFAFLQSTKLPEQKLNDFKISIYHTIKK
jgi:hypothetical protein